jgi:methyl-accepting chemotaxis protein/methyl-accepting chemotaxis protein-1 (serine sensor receptor)
MSRFTLSWRFSIAVGAALSTGMLVALLLIVQLHTTSASYDAVLGQREVQHQDRARVMQVAFKIQVQEWKDLLLRGHNPDNFKKYEKSFKDEERKVQELGNGLLSEVGDPDARALLQDFLAAHVRMGESYRAAITAFAKTNGADFGAADALVKGQDRAPTEQIDKLAARLQQVVKDRQAAESAKVNSAIWRSLLIATLVFLLVIAGVIYIVRATRAELIAVTQSLTDAATGTAAGASQVATSAQALSQGASEQAASLEETSASMEEMASMTRRNAESSQSAAGLMATADTRANHSHRALADMVSAMQAIEESSLRVARIIKTIDEIAFQTNLLALNAAVEAARAGTAGMGFAVVADEVRSLAQRSAQAAKDTAALIDESITRTAEGAKRVDQVAESIGAITESLSSVKGLIEEVSAASQQQSTGIDQVSQAIAQMEKVTQTTAASAEEGAAASEELSAQAEEAMSAVHRLERIVGIERDRAGAPRSTTRTPRGSARPSSPAMGPAPLRDATPEDILPLGTGTYGRF